MTHRDQKKGSRAAIRLPFIMSGRSGGSDFRIGVCVWSLADPRLPRHEPEHGDSLSARAQWDFPAVSFVSQLPEQAHPPEQPGHLFSFMLLKLRKAAKAMRARKINPTTIVGPMQVLLPSPRAISRCCGATGRGFVRSRGPCMPFPAQGGDGVQFASAAGSRRRRSPSLRRISNATVTAATMAMMTATRAPEAIRPYTSGVPIWVMSIATR